MEEFIRTIIREELNAFFSDMKAEIKEGARAARIRSSKMFIPNLVTMHNACNILECTKSELKALMNAKGVSPQKKSGRWYITREELEMLAPTSFN